MTMKTVTDIEQEIAALGEVIADFSEQRRSLSVALRPYWDKKDNITAQIRSTFPGSDIGCLRYAFSGGDLRKAFYDKLILLAQEYGDLAEQYRDVGADLDAAVRNRERLTQRLEHMREKGKLL